MMEEVLIRQDEAYAEFLTSKSQSDVYAGFDPLWIPSSGFDFQQSLVDWAVRKGRSAIFADCGLGKTWMQLVWAENVVRKTNRPVLVITPLAVGSQTVKIEGPKFGIECRKASYPLSDYAPLLQPQPGITVANYERLHHFSPGDFAGVVLDESSILKSFDGKFRSQITEFMRIVPYRLLCTATAAPNDYVELGTSSEALGQLGYLDMLNRFFKNDQHTIKPMRYTGNPRSARPNGKDHTDKWRFKGHAEIPFMQWVCGWARACRKPSDLGFSDEGFVLPDLIERQHLVTALTLPDGMLFPMAAVGLKEQREERRRTIQERCEKVAELVEGHKRSLIWCHLNPEGELLHDLIPRAHEISGKSSDEEKEEVFLAFANGEIDRLITKYKMGGWGMNWQNCDHMTTFPSHSFEQYYQGVRRLWRFGQKNPVTVDIVTTEGEQAVLGNLQRKAAAADKLFSSLVAQTQNVLKIDRASRFTTEEEVPEWL
jgi:hypothetical protein